MPPIIKRVLIFIPLLGIIASMKFLCEITLGEIIAISLTLIGALCILVRWIYISTLKCRHFNLKFCNIDFTNNLINIIFEDEAIPLISRAADAQFVFVKITTKYGVSIHDISACLVKKIWLPNKPNLYPLWGWLKVNPGNNGFISSIEDLDWRNENDLYPNQKIRSRPNCRLDSNNVPHLIISPPINKLVNDSLNIKLEIYVYNAFNGYIEFKLPMANGGYCYKRGKISLRLTDHNEGYQN